MSFLTAIVNFVVVAKLTQWDTEREPYKWSDIEFNKTCVVSDNANFTLHIVKCYHHYNRVCDKVRNRHMSKTTAVGVIVMILVPICP